MKSNRMHSSVGRTLLLVLSLMALPSPAIAAPQSDPPTPRVIDATPPGETAKLVFVHASVGAQWLDHWLGSELGENNYFASDWNVHTNHDPEIPGHDYCSWHELFSDPYWMDVLSQHSVSEGNYTRPMADPGSDNSIIMIKPCFTQYPIAGNPDDAPSGDHGCPSDPDLGWAFNTVGNVKQTLIDLLDVFRDHPDTFFVLVTGPAKKYDAWSDDPIGNGENARAIANWMVDEWLDGYDIGNVMVFDLFNVLTSNAEGEGDACQEWASYPNNPGSGSDLELDSGNHHRLWSGQVQHQVQYDQDYSAYCHSHPPKQATYKMTGEFIPLLNTYYNAWLDGDPPITAPLEADFTASPTFGPAPLDVAFTDASVGDVLTHTWDFGDGHGASGPELSHEYVGTGHYTVTLTVEDGNVTDTAVKPRYIHVVDRIWEAYLPVILRNLAPW